MAPGKKNTTNSKKFPTPQVVVAASPSTLLSRLRRFGWDIVGILILAVASMTLIALPDPEQSGVILNWWTTNLRLWFGWGAVWIVILLGFIGLRMLRYHNQVWQNLPWRRVFAMEVAAFASLVLLAIRGDVSLTQAEAGLDGGRVGWGLAYPLSYSLQNLGEAGKVSQITCLSSVMLLSFGLSMGLWGTVQAWIKRKAAQEARRTMFEQESTPVVSIAPIQKQSFGSSMLSESKRQRSRLPAEFRKKFQIPSSGIDEEKLITSTTRDERLPVLDLLSNETASQPDERNINLKAGLIEKTLSEFGIPAKVVGFRIGPTVTQFAVEPGFVEKSTNGEDANRQKVRVAQISALSRDLALALSAERLRIEAPVPGRPYVGIEVPNTRSSVVRLRPILETESFYKSGSPLTIALGRDVSGQPLVADLAAMPHLLIAGTTNSGKSVCIAALTTCLVMNNTPEDLRLIMIDPKMVELVRFNGLPHLYGKVETNLERILGVLHWTVAEMDNRYRLLEKTHSRNLDTYNRKARRHREMQPLPRIVVLIDELADLMMSAPEQIEPALVRLAQMARATGIHLVVATQRPSTDIVTGLIKANFPARLSFQVASSVDSRVILDATGAENLLGHGDMLFVPPESSSPVRCQGVMVSDQEVEKVITFWQKAVQTQATELPPWESMLKEEAILADQDQLVEEAIKIVRQTQRASTSLLQRKLRVGYPRAARLVDELERMGIVGPASSGGREREVLIDKDEGDLENEDSEYGNS